MPKQVLKFLAFVIICADVLLFCAKDANPIERPVPHGTRLSSNELTTDDKIGRTGMALTLVLLLLLGVRNP